MEIQIKWIKRKQMTHENTYRDDIYSTFIFRHTFSLDFLIQMVYNKDLFVWFFCNSHAETETVDNQMAVFPQQEVKIIMDYSTKL